MGRLAAAGVPTGGGKGADGVNFTQLRACDAVLRACDAVAREGGFPKAAAALGVTQPAPTIQVRALEIAEAIHETRAVLDTGHRRAGRRHRR